MFFLEDENNEKKENNENTEQNGEVTQNGPNENGESSPKPATGIYRL